MSWKSKLEQEYEKETGLKAYHESGGHYKTKYVEWLEAKIEKSTKEVTAAVGDQKQ
jgi:hypothetical protein